MAYVIVAGQLAVEGAELSKTDDQIHKLHNQNLELEDIYLHDTAYTTIFQEAIYKGFQPARTIYLTQ